MSAPGQCKASQALIILRFPASASHPGLLGSTNGWSWPWCPACPTQGMSAGKYGGVLSGFYSVWQLKHMGNMRLWFKVFLVWTKWSQFHFSWIQIILLLPHIGEFGGSISDPGPSPSIPSKWFPCHCLPPFSFLRYVPMVCLPCLSLLVTVLGCILHS